MKLSKPMYVHLGLSLFAFILLMYPGQNSIQTHSLVNRKVKGIQDQQEVYAPLPTLRTNNSPAPATSAQSVIVIDVDSAVILHQKNPDQKLLPASTTKIMTALIALEEFTISETITIGNENRSIGNTSELKAGETLTVEDMIAALLIPSGNDAALALAQHHDKGYQGFVDKMNQKATDLHMKNTQFSNVSGLEQTTHYTTVRDFAHLTKEAMKIDLINKLVGTKEMTIVSVDGRVTHKLKNTNELLGVIEGVRGVKTGWTYNAGECLITSTIRDGHEVIVVMLGSEDRFSESINLIEWSYKNHTWSPFPNISPMPAY